MTARTKVDAVMELHAGPKRTVAICFWAGVLDDKIIRGI